MRKYATINWNDASKKVSQKCLHYLFNALYREDEDAKRGRSPGTTARLSLMAAEKVCSRAQIKSLVPAFDPYGPISGIEELSDV